jgi:glycine hydroxymethyltransferase
MKIQDLIKNETEYQQKQLKLIPSENYTYPAVLQAVGSPLINKYAEGYPGRRYYQGNQNMDQIEQECRTRALQVFGLDKEQWHANVQPVTGSIANLAVYNAILKPNDKILSMYLPHGGHLSHGWQLSSHKPVSFISKIYSPHYYYVNKQSFTFDYDEIAKKATQIRPQIIISGGTAYPRTIDHQRLAAIADKVGAYYLADIAHEAGLIAADVHNSPFPYADFVTMTTRKTLRGPIGAIIICRQKFAKKIDHSVFPGIQGGPMMNSIAGISITLQKALENEFKTYAQQIIKNSQILAKQLQNLDFKLISGGTDKHLILIDIKNKQPDGLIAAKLLELVDIITNKNTIPYDKSQNPWRPSGLRLGTPSITSRGMQEKEMKTIATLINRTLTTINIPPNTKADQIEEMASEKPNFEAIKKEVHDLTSNFPIKCTV